MSMVVANGGRVVPVAVAGYMTPAAIPGPELVRWPVVPPRSVPRSADRGNHSVFGARQCAALCAMPKRPAVFQVRVIIVGRSWWICTLSQYQLPFPPVKYYYEGMQSLRKFRSIGSWVVLSGKTPVWWATSIHINTARQNLLAPQDAYYGRISAKIH